jgi:membrane-bound lytic murein transglycosylase MltF
LAALALNRSVRQPKELIRRAPRHLYAALISFSLLLTAFGAFGCAKKDLASPVQTKEQTPIELPELPDSAQSAPQRSLALPVTFERHTGDLDAMSVRRRIRALVVYSRSGFFYDKGHPKGIYYEAAEEFQSFLNKKLKTGRLKIYVTFIPVRPEQLEQALIQGIGDLIAASVIVTPARQERVDFTIPIATDVKQIIVTGPAGPPVEALDDLSGKEVYVNPITNYYENLQRQSDALQKSGKQPIVIQEADKNLTDDDLLEMVNAGLIPATVTFSQRAEFWSQVFPQLVVHQNTVLASDGQLAWATRKDSPKLKQLLDEFVEGHRLGTSFGNTLLRRYLQNTKWVKDSVTSAEMQKFQAYVGFFKKYAAQYNFDYLMLAAQGYQESMLNQNRKSRRGAVGIMQVIPKYAAAPPISIPSVADADNNIHAGAKMLHDIQQRYFDDPGLDMTNKTLMTFAAYNAGPSRISRLRKRTKTEGLDPNQWFGNVELVVANDVGQETVHYVSNIYKYYVAYKLTLEHSDLRRMAKQVPAR